MYRNRRTVLRAALLALAVIPLIAVVAPGAPWSSGHHGAVGAVYTMSNSASGNEIYAFDRYADGSLEFAAKYATGGDGTGSGLGNQGGVVLSDDHRWLLAVNAGSDSISLFRVFGGKLYLTDVASSHGHRPVSVAIRGRLVYVLNAGGSDGSTDGIAGFKIGWGGVLRFLPGSVRPLSDDDTGPAQIGFSPNGRLLAVTEKATDRITTFRLGRHGYPGYPIVNDAAGKTPFAFAFAKKGALVVSEVFGGGADAGAVSSYRVRKDGSLDVISASVANTETAPCWLVVTPGGRWAFTTNTPSDSLSAYAIDHRGRLTLRDADGRTGEPGAGTNPLDMDLSANGRFLYTLNIGNDTISAFAVGSNGGLTHLGMTSGVPSGANGLAAR